MANFTGKSILICGVGGQGTLLMSKTLTAGLVADDLDSIKSLVARCPAWIECLPSYSAKAAKGVDDVVQAVKTYRANAKRAFRESIPGRIPECLFEGARAAASKTAGGADIGTGPHI